MFSIKTIEVGPFAVNCYLAQAPSRAIVVIDPGADAHLITREISRRQGRVSGYLVTHGHADHISALAEVMTEYPAPWAMCKADHDWAFSSINQIPPYYAVPRRPNTDPVLLHDGQDWEPAPGLRFKILATPGHTQGGLCIWLPEAETVFTGDTLFQGTVGRTDLPDSDPLLLEQSLQKLKKLPPQTKIMPGHGPASTMGQELRSNPFLQ